MITQILAWVSDAQITDQNAITELGKACLCQNLAAPLSPTYKPTTYATNAMESQDNESFFHDARLGIPESVRYFAPGSRALDYVFPILKNGQNAIELKGVAAHRPIQLPMMHACSDQTTYSGVNECPVRQHFETSNDADTSSTLHVPFFAIAPTNPAMALKAENDFPITAIERAASDTPTLNDPPSTARGHSVNHSHAVSDVPVICESVEFGDDGSRNENWPDDKQRRLSGLESEPSIVPVSVSLTDQSASSKTNTTFHHHSRLPLESLLQATELNLNPDGRCAHSRALAFEKEGNHTTISLPQTTCQDTLNFETSLSALGTVNTKNR